MPAVGMRKSTRVFGARILRSGRRLCTAEPGEVSKQQHETRSADNVEDDLIDILNNNSVDNKTSDEEKNQRHNETPAFNRETKQMDIDKKTAEHSNGKRWGAVYQRKRKRLDAKNDVDPVLNSDRRYGKQFSRRRAKRLKGSQATCQVQITLDSRSVMVFSLFLNSILSYMSRVGITLQHLSAFLLSEPICYVYSVHGIHFLQNSTSNTSSGICRITGSKFSVPLFTLNYAAVPSVFMYLHTSLLLRSATVRNSNGMEVDSDSMTSDEEMPSCNTSELYNSGGETGVAVRRNSGKSRAVPWGAATPKSAARTLQLRTVNSRGIQKRRSSRRLNRGRKTAGGHLLTAMSFRNDGAPFSPVKSNQEFISPVREDLTRNFEELKSTLVAYTEDIDASSCSANILVIEADKCYRVQGATITLENSASNQWFVRIRTNGTREYSFMAEKVMRPCSCNRVTRATVWTIDNCWKLEFSNRRDWLIFKRFYRECFERNVLGPTASAIPVPCVVEVSRYNHSNTVPFSRPESYITWKDDELTRALGKGTAIYDMDSEDEVWLNKFNIENESDNQISADVFELIISSFEKSLFCVQDDYLDVKAAVDLCISLERKEVLEAMHSYWIKKRKQKRSALVRVFQCYQPRRTQVLTKAVLRKKRSFNRQASKTGRGKRRTFLQAMAAERDTVDEQKNILKVQEADAVVYRSDDLAVRKRKRAQVLMEVADMSTYKATMALRISEALGHGKSLTDVVKNFLG